MKLPQTASSCSQLFQLAVFVSTRQLKGLPVLDDMPVYEYISPKSADGVTLGLIDSILAVATVLYSRDLSHPRIQEAMEDLRQDKYLKALRRKPYSKKVVQAAEPVVAPYCPYCADTCTDPDDPDGQHDCRYCGGAFAWRQREAHFAQQQAAAGT